MDKNRDGKHLEEIKWRGTGEIEGIQVPGVSLYEGDQLKVRVSSRLTEGLGNKVGLCCMWRIKDILHCIPFKVIRLNIIIPELYDVRSLEVPL